MAWRALHLSRPARLSLADGQLLVSQEEGETRLPIEDLACLVLDTPQATLTTALAAALMAAGVAVMVTDARHHPSGLLLPFHGHHRQAAVAAMQTAASLPLRKRLWQAVVRAKIANQAALLAALGREGAGPLRAMLRHVGSGDPTNVEARAARAYWSHLWPGFRREDEGDRRNALLNYGYAVLRAAVARALVACGLLPAFGIGHAGAANAFNLADDMLEPFRPFADRVAHGLAAGGGRGSLTREERAALAGLLLAECRIGGETMTLLNACERVAQTLVAAMEARAAGRLVLPVLPP